LQAGLRARDGKQLGDALALADPAGSARCRLDWGAASEALTARVGRLWECEDPYSLLKEFWQADALPGAGLWLPAAVLHLRDPQRLGLFNADVRRGLALLDDSAASADPPAERYRLANEALVWLRQQYSVSPVILPDVLADLAGGEVPPVAPRGGPLPAAPIFRGFSGDAFLFLAALAGTHRGGWMDGQRARYQFAVRGPMAELCRSRAARYVEPVLCTGHGWDIDTQAVPGRALTSICKNVYGRSAPYNSVLWITFCRRGRERADAQLFVRLDSSGLRFGLRLDRPARPARRQLLSAVEGRADELHRALAERGALESCRFGPVDEPAALRPLE